MRKKIDVTGVRFGRLVALAPTGEMRWGASLWLCICDCGKHHVAAINSLRSGGVRSCGCLLSETASALSSKHKQHGSPTYKTWAGIIQRCTNPNDSSYQRYGGSGIVVCERWRQSFEAFLHDMGHRPDGMSIDRIDNTKGYEPSNCRWATPSMQRTNQRRKTATQEQIDLIRSLYLKDKKGPKEIAEMLGLGRGQVSAALYSKRSKHQLALLTESEARSQASPRL